MERTRAVVLLSGGLDSTTLLYHMRDLGFDVFPFSVKYGQRHRVELEHAQRICDRLQLFHQVVDLTNLAQVMKGSSLTDYRQEVPKGHYADQSMKATVVPNRNMILISVAAAYAISINAHLIAYAAHAGDHAIYPDCRPEFYDAVGKTLAFVHDDPLTIYAPFIQMTKSEIVKMGIELAVPYEMTWSCYVGGVQHCGTCGTCFERREAFQLAGVQDPTTGYAA